MSAQAELASPRFPSLLAYGMGVLQEGDAELKATLTLEAAAQWASGLLPLFEDDDDTKRPVPPSKPSRPSHLQVVPPNQVPPARKGVDNWNFNKLRLIHSLAHIESYAIDLSWDILVRFSTPRDTGIESTEFVPMPAEFYADWLRIAKEEAEHYRIWARRLEELGSHYGAMPVHDGLWQSADETAHSLLARLAVVHAVHEARGLDQAPRMLSQLETYKDLTSVRLLERIEVDELTHVASGLRWFKYICGSERNPKFPVEPVPTFHDIVRKNFRGSLLPPFNTQARTKAGFTEEWYLPLAVRKERPAVGAVAGADASEQAKDGKLAKAGVAVEVGQPLRQDEEKKAQGSVSPPAAAAQ